MSKLSLLVSLTTADNDYQIEQAKAAEDAAKRHGASLKIVYADNDSITQSQQLLEVIQSRSVTRPDAIIVEPVGGTGFPQVARAAAVAGMGWVVLNRDVDYLSELRKTHRVPLFGVTNDHEEIGRIQGRQIAALLPNGGSVLYIEGPSESLPSKQRTTGMYETKPVDVQVKSIRAQWTEASANKAVSSWLRLSTSQQARFDVVAAQDDSMAIGARTAFHDMPEGPAREHWLNLPYLGIDGMPKSGQAWVRSGMLAATVIGPPNAGQAIDMLVQAMQKGTMPAERTLTMPASFPALGSIGLPRVEKPRVFSAFGK
jgi:ribose transport system substrate-binding protein